MSSIAAIPDLTFRTPLIHILKQDEIWKRGHRLNRKALYFGRNADQRWDDPNQNFGVLYLGSDARCCFMETIGRGVLATRMVPASILTSRGIVDVRIRRDLHLIDLVNSGGLTRISAEGSITGSTTYEQTQKWSYALWSHVFNPDGIYYRPRHDPALTACALFDRCEEEVEITSGSQPWWDYNERDTILQHYGFSILHDV